MKATKITCSVSTTVGVPPRALFDLITDDDRFFDVRPGAVEHQIIERLEGGGHVCKQVYKAGRRTVTQTSRTMEFDPPRRSVDDVEAEDYRALVTTTLDDLGLATRLTIEQEVTLRKPLGAISRRATRIVSERQIAAALRQMKHVAEERTP